MDFGVILRKMIRHNSVFMNSDLKKISIVIVNWNGRKFLPECLESLRHQAYRRFSIILVDNGSTPERGPVFCGGEVCWPDYVCFWYDISDPILHLPILPIKP